MGVNPAVTKAVLVNFAFVTPSTPGYLTSWSGRAARPLASNINAVAGEYVANSAVVPVDSNGGILVYSYSTADVVIDVLGYFNVAPAAVSAGRFVAVPPTRISDTRQPVSASNPFTRGTGSRAALRSGACRRSRRSARPRIDGCSGPRRHRSHQ